MSRTSNPNTSTNIQAAGAASPGSGGGGGAMGGLMPLDAPQEQNAPAGGVFRLDAMAPGMANAEQAMATPKKRKVSNQAIALAILLALGGALIYGMRVLGIGPLTTLAETILPQYDLTRPYAHAADHQKILKDLAANHAARQVPMEEVQKNPFRLADVTSSGPLAFGPDPRETQRASADRAKREAEQKRTKIRSALANLKVNGVIGGSSPVARISGEAVRVGDTIGEEPAIFTVKAIHGRSVELVCEHETFELHMDDDASNSNKAKKK